MKDKEFTTAMNCLFSLVYNNFGSGHPALEIIVDWFSDNTFTEDGIDFAYCYDEEGMTELLRCLMNWDMFWVTDDGKVDIENANEPEIAKLVAPFVTPEMAKQVRESF